MESVLNTDGTPAEIIDELIECQLDSLAKRRLFFTIYFTHFHPGTFDGYAGYTGALDHALMQEKKKNMLDAMDRVFTRGTALGQFAPIQSRYLTAALFGMFISFSFIDGRNTSLDWDVEEMKIAIKQILFEPVLISNEGPTQDVES